MRDIISDRRFLWSGLLLLPSMLALAIASWACVRFSIPAPVLTRDMTALTNVPLYVSCISNLGLLYWCAASAISAFSALLVQNTERMGTRHFFIASALLSFILLLDDMFMFHEALFPLYLGIAEKTVFIWYILMTGLYLILFRRIIVASGHALILGTALTLFTLSALIDQILEKELGTLVGHWLFMIEDGFKLLGLSLWLAFYVLISHELITNGYSKAQSVMTPAQHRRPSARRRTRSKP